MAFFALRDGSQDLSVSQATIVPGQPQTQPEIVNINKTPAGKSLTSPSANFDRFQAAISPRPITDVTTPTINSARSTFQPPTPPSSINNQVTPLPSQTIPSGPLPDTFILNGPDQNKDFEGEEVTFKFGGSIQGLGERLTFETRLTGLDNFSSNWITTSRTEITYRLNFKGTSDIIFQVRTKTIDGRRIDPTPATWRFRVIHSEQWGNVIISSVNPGISDSNRERVNLNNRSGRNLNITGWRLSDLTSTINIPQAVEILQPRSGLNFNSDIILETFTIVSINTQPSPIGFSFRENKCTFNLIFQNQILDENEKYQTCYFDKRFDGDFLRNNWQVYLNLSTGIWDQKSVMILRDRFGAAVDVLEYGF